MLLLLIYLLYAIHWSGLLTSQSSCINRWLFCWPLTSHVSQNSVQNLGQRICWFWETFTKVLCKQFEVQFRCSGVTICRLAGYKSGARANTETYSNNRSMAHSFSNLCSDLYVAVSDDAPALIKHSETFFPSGPNSLGIVVAGVPHEQNGCSGFPGIVPQKF